MVPEEPAGPTRQCSQAGIDAMNNFINEKKLEVETGGCMWYSWQSTTTADSHGLIFAVFNYCQDTYPGIKLKYTVKA